MGAYSPRVSGREDGIINAWDTKDGWGGNPCHCTAYQQFWGDTDGVGNYYFYWLTNISRSTTTDSYAVVSAGTSSDHWDVWKDGTQVGTSTDQVSKTAWLVATDADQYHTFGSADKATTFNMYDGIATNYSWTNPAWNHYFNTRGCGSYSPPCFNGTTYSNDEWSWNEHG